MRILFLILIQLGFAQEIAMLQMSESPRIYLLENFLSKEECQYLKEQATPLLTTSTVVSHSFNGNELHPGRTSKGMFFKTHSENEVITKIEKRIADITNYPIENGEGIQVLNYAIGGEYRPHFDYFDPKSVGGKACLDRGGQRVATVIMYLNTVEEGGETIFPKANVKVKPIQGHAVLFYNCTPEEKEDPLSFHGGAPVKKGEKWIATKWIRQHEFN